MTQTTAHNKKATAQVGGFTLIELMVVVAIIAILSTIGIGGFSNAQKKARDARRRSDVKTIQTAMISSSDTNGNYDANKGKSETGGTFPLDPKKDQTYLLYAPISPKEAVLGDSNVTFIENTKTNSGVVCAALEIPDTGNTELKGGSKNQAASKCSMTEIISTQCTDKGSEEESAGILKVNKVLAAEEEGVTPKVASYTFTNITDNLGIDEKDGSIIITDCKADGSTNCNMFCATF